MPMSEHLIAQLPAIALLVLLVASQATFLFGARWAPIVAVAAAFAELAVAGVLAVTVATRGPLYYRIGGWGGPLGIDLRVDGLAALMILLAAVIGTAITVYALGYFCDKERYRFFWPLWLLLWGSLVALFSSNDAFNLYVCLELVSVSAVALVSLAGTRAALAAAMRYLLAALMGSVFYLLGVAMLYGAAGALDISVLAQAAHDSVATQAGLALILVGLSVKTALVPLHFWLPPAHANAVTPVSAALSALVIKGSFYIALRLIFALDGADIMPGLPVVLGVMGAIAIVWGAIQAMAQVRLKMMVAYSTVAQVGYLFVLFPLAAAGAGTDQAVVAVTAGGFHVVAHALAKASMFLTAGSVLKAFGHDRIAELGGMARRAPLLALSFSVAGVSMIGLPPSGGFVTKWLYSSVAFTTGHWWWALPVLAGGLLAGVYVFRVSGVFLREPDEGGESPVPLPWTMTWVPLTLAVASLLVGVLGQPILDLITPAAQVMAAGVAL